MMDSQNAIEQLQERIARATWLSIFYTVIFGVGYRVYYLQAVSPKGNTINIHLKWAEALGRGDVTIFHGLYFRVVNVLAHAGIPREHGGPIVLSVFVCLTLAIIHVYLFRELGGVISFVQIMFLTAVAGLATAIYVPFFNESIYIGQWGPNVYHNSTLTTVKVFTLALSLGVIGILREEHRWRGRISLPLISGLIVLSAYAKPTFLLVLVPSALVYSLWRCPRTRSTVIRFVILFAPALIFLGYQHFAAYEIDSSPFAGRRTTIAPFTVWRSWSPNVGVSVLLAILYPVVVFFFRRKEMSYGGLFAFAWLLTIFGFLQAALLVEVSALGEIKYSANWFGGYLVGNHILFVAAIAEFYKGFGTGSDTSRARPYELYIGSAVMVLHALSGIVYLYRLTSLLDYRA